MGEKWEKTEQAKTANSRGLMYANASTTNLLLSAPSSALFPQNSQFGSSTDLIAQLNFSRRVLEKNFSIGTSNFFENTTVRRGSM